MTETHGSHRRAQADLPTGEMDPVELEDTEGITVEPTEGPAGSDTPDDGAASKRLLSAGALMAAGTMTSRILGFVRVAMVTFVLGNDKNQGDMLSLATTIPTSLYILFAGGALNTVLVPQIVRAVKDDPDGGEAYTNRIMTAFLLVVGAVTLALTLLAPQVIGLYTADSWKTPAMAAHYQSMVFLGYLCLPSIFFYGVFFLLGQVLNAHDKFGPMMWAPLANNVVQIIILGIYLGIWGISDGEAPFTTGQALLLGGGATFGIVMQTVWMILALRSTPYRFRPRFDLRGTGLGHTFHLAKWTLGFVLVNQLAVVVVNKLATSATVEHGSGAGLLVYNNAYLVWVLPHSLITVSLATAMLPSASRLAAAGDLVGVRRETMRTIRLATALLLPAAAAFIALALPLSSLLFGHGAGAGNSRYVGWTLIAFAIGLVPFTIQYVCLRAFYALEDTRATFWQQCVIAALNVLLAIAFVVPVQRPELVAPGLALAYSLSYVFGLALSYARLGKRLPGLSATEVVRHLVRLTLAVAPGAVLAWWITTLVGPSKPMQALGLVGGGLLALALFFALARVLRITEVTEIIGTLLRRGRRGAATTERSEADTPTEQAGDVTDESDHIAALETEREVVSVPFPDAEVAEPFAPASPAEDEDGDVEDTAEELHPVRARPGQEIGGRYRLEEVLVRRSTTQTWRAFDEVLSRPVLVHLLPPERDNDDLLLAARRAASATDSRFLRVLDVARTPAVEAAYTTSAGEVVAGFGACIVCEYAPGVTLESLLASGPLSALEAAWLVHEVADALAGMHHQGLYHQRISPDTVVVTAAGNVKIVGFLLEASLTPGAQPYADTDDPELIDVLDLGRLLYCTLVSRWPGGHAYGMAAAPTDHDGHVFTPRQVRAGVSPALDRVCDQILSDLPRGKEAPLRTASEVADELGRVLGTADASHDLERRMRYPVPVVAVDTGEPLPAQSPLFAESRAPSEDAPADMYFGGAQLAGDDEPTGRVTPATARTPADAEPTVQTGVPLPPTPPAERTEGGSVSRPSASQGRAWLIRLVVLVLLVLIGSLIAVALRRAPVAPQAGPSPTPVVATPTPQAIASAIDFDPQGDTREEHRNEAPLAVDGKPDTAWTTMTYRVATMDKDGVGLIVDLGRPVAVSQVDVRLRGTGTTFDVRAPGFAPETTTRAPDRALTQWRAVGRVANAAEQATVRLERPVTTRFVLVNLTQLPRVGQGYQGAIAEVTVRG